LAPATLHALQVSAVLKALDRLPPERGLEDHQCVGDLDPRVAKIDENHALLGIRTLFDLLSINFRLRESGSRRYLSNCFVAHVRNSSAGGDIECIYTCLAPYSVSERPAGSASMTTARLMGGTMFTENARRHETVREIET
jgi:hypothetical protein